MWPDIAAAIQRASVREEYLTNGKEMAQPFTDKYRLFIEVICWLV